MSISSITSAAGTASKADSALSTLGEDYTRFMKLLVAQIQHQDPLEPVDGTDFIAQVATLTQVEQTVQTNKNLESLSSQLAVSGALFETALIGREITVPSQSFQIDAEGGRFAYQLASNASSVTAIIRNEAGEVVRRIENLSGSGQTMHDVAWDGKNASGVQLPVGRYSVELASSGGDGAYNTYMTGRVSSVEYLPNQQLLRLEDGSLVDSGDIVRAG